MVQQFVYLTVTEVVELLDHYFLNHFRISNHNHGPLPQIIAERSTAFHLSFKDISL